MKKIFLDANVIIDYLDASSKDHAAAVDCMRIIRKHFGKPVVSPITFIITDFLLGKFARNKQWHKDQMKSTFSAFEMTPIYPKFIDNVFKSFFTDLEDAVQHECALHAKSFVIITKNISDYFDSKVPAVHPTDFVRRYNSRVKI